MSNPDGRLSTLALRDRPSLRDAALRSAQRQRAHARAQDACKRGAVLALNEVLKVHN